MFTISCCCFSLLCLPFLCLFPPKKENIIDSYSKPFLLYLRSYISLRVYSKNEWSCSRSRKVFSKLDFHFCVWFVLIWIFVFSISIPLIALHTTIMPFNFRDCFRNYQQQQIKKKALSICVEFDI